MKLGAVDAQVPALQPWADQFGDGATAIRRTDGDADRGGGAVGVLALVAVISLMGEPPSNLKACGLVEVRGATAIVTVSR